MYACYRGAQVEVEIEAKKVFKESDALLLVMVRGGGGVV